MIGEMRDARDHPGQLDSIHLTIGLQRLEPPMRFVAQAVADLLPRGLVYRGHLPRVVPHGVGEGVAAVGCPPVHQRQPVAEVLRMRRDRRAAVGRMGRRFCRELVERLQQPYVTGIENEAARPAARWARPVNQLREQSGEGSTRVCCAHEGIIHAVAGAAHALVRRRLLACALAAAIAIPLVGHRGLHAQSAANPRVDALVSLAEAKMKEYGVPGVALGVVADGETTIRGLGVTNVEDPLPVTEHTVFPIASISKTFAATAMMRLVEQGKVELRAPVRKYLPDFRVRDEAASRDVTVWHLLTHLGGWEGQVSGPERGTDTLRNFMATTLPDLMQVAPPGKAWSYNNAGFSIAGRVIEVVTGTSINQAIRDLVFRPLGLDHAGTTPGEFIVQRFAAGHTTRDGKTLLQRPFSPSTSVTAGGVGLCITDLLAYARFHMGDGTAANGEHVLARASLEQMRTVQAHKQGTDDDIGLAWHIRQVGPIRTFGHGGTLGGHILLLELVPQRNFAIAILA